MVNPVALANNIRQTIRVCPAWSDRLKRLMWLYHDKPLVRFVKTAREQQLRFRYPPPINDLDLLVRDNHGSDAFILGEVFDHQFYNFSLPFQPKTILDLGANAGFTAIFLARMYSHAAIACVEPMPGNLEILAQNLKLNGVSAKVFPMAIATHDGTLEMEIARLDYAHKVCGISPKTAAKGTTLKVEAISVSGVMSALGWSRISLLKVDIEGYECVLLRKHCQWLDLVDAICIECHEGYSAQDLHDLAKRFGFEKPRQLAGIWLMSRAKMGEQN